MAENSPVPENELVNAAVQWLRSRLPAGWNVTARTDLQSPDLRLYGAIDIRANNGAISTILVEAKRTFTPRDTDQLLGGMTR